MGIGSVFAPFTAAAATFNVTSTSGTSTTAGCDADCSLHDAIVAANATIGADTIQFAIAGTGVKTIALDADGLPAITRPVTINGYTQIGAATNTATTGSNAVLTVALTRTNPNAINDTMANALAFTGAASGSAVRGIAFVQLGATTVSFIAADADDMSIDGNFFGTNAAGDADGGQAPSAAITVGTAADNVVIGGASAASRNLFAGLNQGIALFGRSTIVRNNVFGLRDNGTGALPLSGTAVLVGGTQHRIGGTGPLEGNTVANTATHGVTVSANSLGNTIRGNTFRNIAGLSIDLAAPNDPSSGVTPNDEFDVDIGANDLQNHPRVVSASASGSNTRFDVVFEGFPERIVQIDIHSATLVGTDGFAEGQQLVGSVRVETGEDGIVTGTLDVPATVAPTGSLITVTATDEFTGDTSEFAPPSVVAATLIVNSTNDVADGACNAAHCSLRDAIEAANAAPDRSRIEFAIPGAGPHEINVAANGLPIVAFPVDLLGGSQPGSQPNTIRLDGANDAVRRIVLSMPTATSGAGLLRFAPPSQGSTVSGIAFRRAANGAAAFLVIDARDVIVTDAAFGLAADGITDGGDSPATAVVVAGDDNRIGGPNAADRVQFGGTRMAISIEGDNNELGNVTIGLDALGNATVGAIAPETINVSGSLNRIVDLGSEVNRIIGSSGKAIMVRGGGRGNAIKGTTFEHNGGIPIDLQAPGDGASGITTNDAQDADTGPNDLQNHPVITEAVRQADGFVRVSGRLDTAPGNGDSYLIEIYFSDAAHPAGSGEGATRMTLANITTGGNGSGTFTAFISNLPETGFLTATATSLAEFPSTSEFSPAFSVARAPLVVVNTAAEGTGSLRAAITTANQVPGPDRITFAIPGAPPFRIDVGVDGLPTITESVSIDGYTQPGSAPNSASVGFNGVVRIEVTAGFQFNGTRLFEFGTGSSGSRLRGVSMVKTGESIDMGVFVHDADSISLDGNMIGVDPTGFSTDGLDSAVVIADATRSIGIGGADADRRNIIVGRSTDLLLRGDDHRIDGNFFGRHPAFAALSEPDGQNVAVFGTGIRIGESLGNTMLAHRTGVFVFDGGQVAISRNVVPEHDGIGIDLAPAGPTLNDAGDADSGPNGLQNQPVITAAESSGGVTTITGILDGTPDTPFRIELFAATENAIGTAQPTEFLRDVVVVTDGNGPASFQLTLSPPLGIGTQVTATATSLANAPGDTSEFAPPAIVSNAVLVVNNAGDTNDGVCSISHCTLREAMLLANLSGAVTRIQFDIASAEQVIRITPLAPLPPILQPLILDGYSQPGTSANTAISPPNNAVIRIVLDGSSIASLAGDPQMIAIRSASVDIQGLSIVGLDDGTGGNEAITIPIDGNVGTSNLRIRGNYIGVLPDGFTADGNRVGIRFIGDGNDFGNEIGGTLPEHQNLIAGNREHGIDGATPGINILNNLIGTARDGSTPRGNGGNGIRLAGVQGGLVTGNVIAFNGLGVGVADTAGGFEIDPNSIHGNSALGIDLGLDGVTPNDPLDADDGANRRANSPELTLISGNGQERQVLTSLAARPATLYAISHYAERLCGPNGLAQGERFLGTEIRTTATDGTLAFTRTFVLPTGFSAVTAIATDRQNGDTSEFSRCAAPIVDGVFEDSFE